MEHKNNPRKFRLWDNKLLHDSLQLCVQYQAAIEETIMNSETLEENEVLMSTVPTETLYDLATCYIAMYEKLLLENLIQSNINPSNLSRNNLH